MEQDRNFAQNKTKKVAWFVIYYLDYFKIKLNTINQYIYKLFRLDRFVSNCGARNGRLNYAHELQKHIQVNK